MTCETCNRTATGECYSMSVFLGYFCDVHGGHMMDSAKADFSCAIEED